ncbi:MAG TPA: [protein-PII] uridylyltransferase [Thiobacillaceae bacterium]|nr:[protein-PII] uridylyltransferase [Thiobacillaceae bacterium]
MAHSADTALWREEYARGRARLQDGYLADRRPAPLLHGLSRLTDRLMRHIWQAHRLPAGSALVAVGGYGRGELFPQSDVDVLILLDDGLSGDERTAFEPLIGLFWDVGLPIGHSVRSLTECLDESAGDTTIQTNLLESRLLAGDRQLYEGFRYRFRAALEPRAFYEAKLREQRSRHGRFADRALLLEPNIKESPGGLRDLQTIIWVAHAAGLPTSFPGLARQGLLGDDEVRLIGRHLRFLNHLRIHLHLLAKRREDRLLFEYQEPLAERMGFLPNARRRASELLMQRYYRVCRELSLANEYLLSAFRQELFPVGAVGDLPGYPDYLCRGDQLDIRREDLYEAHPEAILPTFQALQRHPELTRLTPRALRALWRAGRKIDDGFRRDPLHRAQFMALLHEPRGITHSFRLMHRLGLLGRYIPALGRITGQLQHDGFHIYPVDEHILMVLRNIRRVSLPQFAHELPLAHRLMADCNHKELLYLAALFHDIAKGRGGDHSTLGEADARRFCRAHGLEKWQTDLVAWLVRHHLTLSATAQKQDLSDPEVIQAFAAQCGDTRRLTALYLLTVADIRATNPKIWNAWKEKLLRELYLAARARLEGDRPAPDLVEAKKEEARATLRLYGYPDGAEKSFWNRLDDIYFLRMEAQEIAWQTRRLLPLLPRQETIVRARLAPIGEGIEVTVYTPDRSGLFARISGFFAGMHYSVLEAKVHTTRDGYALDSFLAMDPQQPHAAYRDILGYVEYELTRILTERPPLAEPVPGRLSRQLRYFPIQPQVSLTASEGGSDYVLSLIAGDRPGLIHQVAWVLHRHGINLKSAKINTLANRAEDVFVISGGVLTQPGEGQALERDLLEILKAA